MSKQLAISATLSVLMMSMFVLFGTESEPDSVVFESTSPAAMATIPDISLDSAHLLPILR